MRKLTTTALALLLLLSCAGCKENDNITAFETRGTTAPVTTVETTTEATTETTTEAETTTEIITEAPIDPNEFLKDCVVYDVTVENSGYFSPFEELETFDISEKPEKIALRFTDAEGLEMLIRYEKVGENYSYYVKHIRNNSIGFSVESHIEYHPMSFGVQYKNGTTIICDGDGFGRGIEYYIVSESEYYALKNYSNETEVCLTLSLTDEGKIEYKKLNAKYQVNNSYDYIMAYGSDEDFAEELGAIVLEDGEVAFVPETTMTFGEWYKTDRCWWSGVAENHGFESFAALAEAYKQHMKDNEGDERSFWEKYPSKNNE